MLACYIRRAAGTHEYLYYDSAGQRRAEGWRGSSDNERPRANLAARGRRPGGYIMPFLATYHLHTINVQHALRALPYTMGTSGGPASLPCYLAASFTTNSIKTTPRNASPRCLFRGATPLLILQFPQFPGHAHPNLAAFGRIPADHAVPVLVASPPPAGVRVGEARVHARPVAQARAAGEPGAVVARDGDARRPAADARRWASGNRETRRPPAATPAPPPATTGVRMTGGGACVVWRACGRPCTARGPRCSNGPSSDASAGTAVRTRSRWTGTTCRA